MDETSLSLLDRASSSGDGSSWDRLVALYQPLMRRWLAAYDVQGADADDLVQEVLTVVAQELPRFHHNARTGAFRNWLRQILTHRLQNYWRTRRRRPTAAGGSRFLAHLHLLEDDASQASRVWNEQHDRHVIAQLMEQVRPSFLPKTWEAFRRQVFDGQRPEAIAADLDMKVGAVYMARCRVLSALRREAAGLTDVD